MNPGILITLICLLSVAFAEQLECDFISHNDGYNCEMKSTFEEPKEVSSVIGDHKFGRNNEGVEVFFITDVTKTKYVPSKVCWVFSNMNKYDIYGSTIVELKKDIFEGCGSVKKVVIKYLKLKTLEEDLLTELPNMEHFSLGFTSIEVLPQKLFKDNKNLKFIDLSYNQLKIITTEFPSELTMLSVLNNNCIDAHYDARSLSETTSLMDMLKKIVQKCSGSNPVLAQTDLTAQTRLIEEQITKNENNIKNFETKLENMEVKLNNQIETSIRDFKVSQVDFDKKVADLTKNLDLLQKSSKEQLESYFKTINQLTDDSRILKVKLERTEEYKDASKKFESEINRNENLLVTLFGLQLVMIGTVIVIFVYRKFSRN